MFAKSVYKDLILNVAQCTNLQDKWEQNTTNNMLMTNKCFTHIYKITIDNTLRSFQYKLLNRIIYFNDKLFMFNISNTNVCDFCNDSIDSIEHRLWLCVNTRSIWKDITHWYNQIFSENVLISYFDVITNISNNTLLDFIILCTKYYIFKCFNQKKDLRIEALTEEIQYLEKIEKEIAIKKEKTRFHICKWRFLSTI